MMRWILALILSTGVAQAEAPPETDIARCTGIADRLEAQLQDYNLLANITLTFEGPVLADGWCTLRDVIYDTDRSYGMRFRIAEIAWRGLAEIPSDVNPLPQAVSLRVRQFQTLPKTGDPLMDYALAQQFKRADMGGALDYAWDSETGVASLERFFLRFGPDNHLTLRASLSGVDARTLQTLSDSELHIILDQLAMDAVTHGMFEELALIPLAQMILRGDDPEAEVLALKANATAFVMALPADVLSETSRGALLQLIDVMPNPNGRLQMTVDNPLGWSAQKIVEVLETDGPMALITVPKVKIDYAHEPLE